MTSRASTDLALALDPVLLAVQAGVVPDAWQVEVLRTPAERVLLNCCRQSGKSTIAALLAVHCCVYEPGALVLLLSPTLRQSSELFKKCTRAYHALGEPARADTETKLTLELRNGSRLVSLPGSEVTVRGFSAVRLLVVDEAARVSDDLLASVRPMLAVSGGRLITLSTPWGKRGWWFEAWANGGPTWERYEVPADQCPRIPPAFLEEERRALGPLWYASEYLCQFVDAVDAVFPSDLVAGLVSEQIVPLVLPGSGGLIEEVPPWSAVSGRAF